MVRVSSYPCASHISERQILVELQIRLRARTQSLELAGMIYWFTGQPGAGKTTLALALQAVLRKSGHTVVHLDGEFLREITGNRDFTEAGRTRNIRAGQQLATKLHTEGVMVVASF